MSSKKGGSAIIEFKDFKSAVSEARCSKPPWKWYFMIGMSITLFSISLRFQEMAFENVKSNPANPLKLSWLQGPASNVDSNLQPEKLSTKYDSSNMVIWVLLKYSGTNSLMLLVGLTTLFHYKPDQTSFALILRQHPTLKETLETLKV